MTAWHGVAATDAAAEQLVAGAPVLELPVLSSPAGLEPGRPVRLLDRHGEVLACGVADPENGLVQIFAPHEVRALDRAFFRERLAAAARLRRGLGLVDGVSAYRLVNAEGDGLPGLVADVYGAFAVVSAASRGLLPYARLLAEEALAVHGVRGVVVKVRAKDPQDRSSKDEVLGERPPEKLVVHELAVPYEVHLLGSLNVGLFCDMREHRRGLHRFVRDRRVLNTFAYTGALSVTAARAGASAVTSVDLSGGVLSWAKENFRLSGLDPTSERFRFEVGDVRRFLKREQERGASYDVIILDPPTVSAARASQWSMKRDYPDLIASASRLLPPDGGLLWVSANARRAPGVLRFVDEAVRRAGRPASIIELGGLPPDFPTPARWPESRYLEVCLLWIGAR